MMDVGYLGAMFGIGLFITWIGYYLAYMPNWVKGWVLRKKWRIFGLDMIIIILGNQVLNQASGTLTAGIGTMVFGLLCFSFSLLMISLNWGIQKFRKTA